MKPKDFSQPSMIVQNMMFQSQDESNFDQFRVRRAKRNKLTDKLNIQQKSEAKKYAKKIQPLNNTINNETFSVDFKLTLDPTEAFQQDAADQQFIKSQKQKIFDSSQNENQNKNLLLETSKTVQQVRAILSDENFPLNQDINVNQVNHLPFKNKDSQKQKLIYRQSQIQKLKGKSQISNFLWKVKKSQNFCLQFDEQQDSEQDKQVQTNRTDKKRQTLKKSNYDGSPVSKRFSYPNKGQDLNSIQIRKKQQETLKQILIFQTKKNNLLLMDFDDDQSSGDQKQTTIDIQDKNKRSKQPDESIHDEPQIYKKNNIFLNDFGDSSDEQAQNQVGVQRPINLSKNCEDQDIEFLRPINIIQFLRMTSQNYVYQPIPKNCVFQTIVKRHSSKQKSLVYQMFDSSTFKSILKVKKCSQGFEMFTSQQLLSGSGPKSKSQKSCQQNSCALINSNFFGTQFNCFKFNRSNQKPDFFKLHRLITIEYHTNIFGLKGPRRMQVYITAHNYIIRGDKNFHQIYDTEKQQNMLCPMNIQKYINKPPRWNNQISAFVLNFNGRATVSSVKNFIIARDLKEKKNLQNQPNHILFGKIQKNVFNLDIKHPFNLVQGLALALSSFDKKIGCQ